MTAKRGLWLGLALAVLSSAPNAPPTRAKDPDIGRSFQVPYRLTETNHFLVRMRIDGKGPYNFLIDTGAPAFFISSETAKEVGLTTPRGAFWTEVDRLDFEGGPKLRKVKARIEDLFQLVSMNALGLPGAKIDGILGYTILGRFRITIDPTADRMTWTRLDFEPKEPFIPEDYDRKKDAPAEVRAMDMIGPLAQLMAGLVGKQPEEKRLVRGNLGLELDGLTVRAVWPESPADKAGLRAGDRIVKARDRAVDAPEKLRTALADVRPGDEVAVTVRRGDEELDKAIRAGEGF